MSLRLLNGNLIDVFFLVGTFAVISLMIAQAIEDVLGSSVNASNMNETFSFSNDSNSLILNEKISIATTLALLVGIFQVNFNN